MTRPPREKAHEKRAAAPRPAPPPLPLTHPATLIVALVAALGLVASVSFRLIDTDFWQHLVVGKAIWTQGIPMTHQWTWPWYGTPEVSWVGKSGWSPSWLFRALIWPVWEAGGVTGLFVWRWATTLLAFGFAWMAARKLGARGLAPLVVIVWCSLIYRHRSQIRPETLTAVWLGLELWLLAIRSSRLATHFAGAAPAAGREGRAAAARLAWTDWALVAVACAWANTHISYFLFFVVLGAHLAGEWAKRRAFPRELGLVGLASAAACFLNPYGWQVLWQPFSYFLALRNEPMFRGIGELRPLSWVNNQTDGVFFMLALWPLLILWRWRKHGLDVAEAILCAFFTWYMAQSERFFGAYAIVAATYFSRDVESALHAWRWPRLPASPGPRAALAAAAIVLVGAAEWTRPDRPLQIEIDLRRFPVGAMDFMERHGVGGHGFSQYRVASYQLFRFWPDRDRLPFMDIHNTGTPADRAGYVAALSRRDGWRTLDRGDRFDYVVLDPFGADSLMAALDADSAMALVFVDDTGVLYLRRNARNAALADSFGYRLLGGGPERATRVFASLAAARRDTAAPGPVRALAAQVRTQLLFELERMATSSVRNARANSIRGSLAISEERYDDARVDLEAALRTDPRTPLAHFRLASIALMQNRAQDAIEQYELERRVGERPGLDLGIGMARRLAGDEAAAQKAFRRESERWPGTMTGRAAEQAARGVR